MTHIFSNEQKRTWLWMYLWLLPPSSPFLIATKVQVRDLCENSVSNDGNGCHSQNSGSAKASSVKSGRSANSSSRKKLKGRHRPKDGSATTGSVKSGRSAKEKRSAFKGTPSDEMSISCGSVDRTLCESSASAHPPYGSGVRKQPEQWTKVKKNKKKPKGGLSSTKPKPLSKKKKSESTKPFSVSKTQMGKVLDFLPVRSKNYSTLGNVVEHALKLTMIEAVIFFTGFIQTQLTVLKSCVETYARIKCRCGSNGRMNPETWFYHMFHIPQLKRAAKAFTHMAHKYCRDNFSKSVKTVLKAFPNLFEISSDSARNLVAQQKLQEKRRLQRMNHAEQKYGLALSGATSNAELQGSWVTENLREPSGKTVVCVQVQPIESVECETAKAYQLHFRKCNHCKWCKGDMQIVGFIPTFVRWFLTQQQFKNDPTRLLQCLNLLLALDYRLNFVTGPKSGVKASREFLAKQDRCNKLLISILDFGRIEISALTGGVSYNLDTVATSSVFVRKSSGITTCNQRKAKAKRHRKAIVIQKLCRGALARRSFAADQKLRRFLVLCRVRMSFLKQKRSNLVIQCFWRRVSSRRQMLVKLYAGRTITGFCQRIRCQKQYSSSLTSVEVLQRFWRSHSPTTRRLISEAKELAKKLSSKAKELANSKLVKCRTLQLGYQLDRSVFEEVVPKGGRLNKRGGNVSTKERKKKKKKKGSEMDLTGVDVKIGCLLHLRTGRKTTTATIALEPDMRVVRIDFSTKNLKTKPYGKCKSGEVVSCVVDYDALAEDSYVKEIYEPLISGVSNKSKFMGLKDAQDVIKNCLPSELSSEKPVTGTFLPYEQGKEYVKKYYQENKREGGHVAQGNRTGTYMFCRTISGEVAEHQRQRTVTMLTSKDIADRNFKKAKDLCEDAKKKLDESMDKYKQFVDSVERKSEQKESSKKDKKAKKSVKRTTDLLRNNVENALGEYIRARRHCINMQIKVDACVDSKEIDSNDRNGRLSELNQFRSELSSAKESMKDFDENRMGKSDLTPKEIIRKRDFWYEEMWVEGLIKIEELMMIATTAYIRVQNKDSDVRKQLEEMYEDARKQLEKTAEEATKREQKKARMRRGARGNGGSRGRNTSRSGNARSDRSPPQRERGGRNGRSALYTKKGVSIAWIDSI